MKEYFIYDDKVYKSEEAVDEAIIEKIGHNYNNIDVTQTREFELEAETIKTVTVDEVGDHVLEKANYIAVEPITTPDRIANDKETSTKMIREKIHNIEKLVKKFNSNEERSGLIIRKLIDELDELKIEYQLYHTYHARAKIKNPKY